MTQAPADIRADHRVILVTGPSGAGRSTAINVLEDMGFEAIDNLPLTLLPRLLDGPVGGRPLALGLDTRNRDFSTAALIETIDRLEGWPGIAAELLYLDCTDDELQHRFSATRRRHPMAPAESPEVGIALEKDLLGPVRARADILIDTTEMTPHQLRDDLHRLLNPRTGAHMAVTINSFSYKRGLPRGVDMVFDGRFLRNPYWVPALRAGDGRDPAVAEYVQGDPRFAPFFGQVRDLALLLLPAYLDEGKAHFAIGFGCSGGQHRSVALAEMLGKALAEEGWQVSIRHRELERRQPAQGDGAGVPRVTRTGKA
ncbi:UPF0042 nucleotide-binding protein [Lutimaribacter pacificus]|uniref:UPF0042 nucleotide-binding protein n=1 Tax=Lutimaribacter pacificus TaxID=391948 RepID=A0A1H0I2X7_9RHOB|nr:RNase adapter RapZ [Lutimaribacter pacificus]SDO25739.1 UPF0042 nucleotide-binding protein [Lutimaribacter pacificus]SHK27433.1 UPF0042 nucleotide-binding protein [Lutimaribacter pacificus]